MNNNPPSSAAVLEKVRELNAANSKHIARHPDLHQRINSWFVAKTGVKLPTYVGGPASEQDKIALLDEIIGIIGRTAFDLLPASVNGQATSNGTPAPAPAPRPAAPKPPAVVTAQPESNGHNGHVAIDEEGDVDPETAQLEAEAKAAEAKAAAARAAAAKAKAAARPAGLTEEQVRAIVHEAINARLREVFGAIAKELE